MCPWKLELRHVAGNALVRGRRARFGARFSATMACLAFRIIVHGIAGYLMVRVMTRETADAWVVRVVTLATREPVWLETDIRDVQQAL